MAKQKKSDDVFKEKSQRELFDVDNIESTDDALQSIVSLLSESRKNADLASEAFNKGSGYLDKQKKQLEGVYGVQRALGKSISETAKKRLDASEVDLKLQNRLVTSSTNTLEMERSRLETAQSLGVTFKKYSNIFDDTIKQSEQLTENLKSQINFKSDLINGEESYIDFTSQRQSIADKILNVEMAISSSRGRYAKRDKAALRSEKQKLEYIAEQLVQQEGIQNSLKRQSELYKHAHEDLMGMSEGILNAVSNVPLVGKYLHTHLNIDGLKDKLNNAISIGLQDGVGQGIKAFGGLNLAILGSIAIFAGILFAAKKLFDVFAKIDGMTSEIAKNQGLSKQEAQEQLKFATGMANSTNSIWVNSEGILEATSEVRENLGGMLPSYENMNERGKELIKNQQMLTEAFHLTGEEATGFQNTAQLLGVSTSELIANVTQVENAIESTTGGTINTKEIMQDIAKIPPSIAAGFKGTTTELIATVAKAKSLGMNLEQINAIGEASLDIESSLANEMEARVLTGRNINLDAMRQAQLMGDQSKVMEELVKNAGTYSEFKAMDSIQQKALAKAMGMTTDEMTTMLQKAELQNQLGQDISKYSAEELETMVKKGKITGEQAIAMAEQAAAEKRSASVTESMNAIWGKIKDVIFGLVAGPLGDFATYLSDALSDGDALNGIMDAIKGTFSVISTIVNIIVTPIGWMVWAFGQINSLIDGIFGFFSSGKDDVEGTESGFKNILKAVTAIGGGLLLWKKLLKPMKGMIGKVAGGIKDKIMPGKSKAEDIVSNKKSKGPGAMEKFAKGISKIDGKKLLAGAAAMVLLAGAVYIMAKAMKEFEDVGWEGALLGIGVLVLMAATMVIVGSSLTATAPVLLAAGAMMVLFAASLWIVAKAVQEFAVAFNMMIPVMQVGFGLLSELISTIGGAISGVITAIGDSMEKVFGSIIMLASIEGGGANLIAMGAGLIAIAVGLAALTAGSIIDGIASLFGGGSAKWLDTLKETSEINGDNISKVGEGLMSIASAFEALSKVDLDKVGKALDKVESLSEGDIGDKLLKVTNAIGITKPKETDESTQDSDESLSLKKIDKSKPDSDKSLLPNEIDTGKAKSTPDSDASLSPNSESDTQTQILELLKVIASSLSQPVNLNLDGQTLGKLEKATTLNRQMRLGVDNSYGQTVQT